MSLQKCETAYGPVLCYGKDEYIGRSLYNYGEWSGDECDKLIELANGGTVVDVGANVGYFSLALAHSGCKVYAFEPQHVLYDLLVKNVTGYDVGCFNRGLGDKAGIGKMPRIRYGERGNYGGLSIGGRSELGSIEVYVEPLDRRGLQDISLLKVDVEGYELQVLKGAVETIERCSPILYVEDDRPEKRDALRSFIKSLGYKIEEHTTPLYRENNFRGLKKNIWDQGFVSMNIICSR